MSIVTRGMRATSLVLVAVVVIAVRLGAAHTPIPSAVRASDQELAAAINQLGAFEFSTRLAASRTVRRAAPAQAVPALTAAARSHADSFVQYRALVLLAGFDDPSTPAVMESLIADRNDRIRAVVFAWYEHHRSAAIVPALIAALPREVSEFVRPSLTRALAAQNDARAQTVLLPLVSSGEDFFRAEVIQALGDYHVTAAGPAILAVAGLDGPLRDDAVLALGKLGDVAVLDVLAQLQRSVPRERQPAIAAAGQRHARGRRHDGQALRLLEPADALDAHALLQVQHLQ